MGDISATSAKVLALSMLLTALLIVSKFLIPVFGQLDTISLDLLIAPFAFAALAVALGYLPAFLAGLPIWLFFDWIGGKQGWSRKTTAYISSAIANVTGVLAIFVTIALISAFKDEDKGVFDFPLFGDGYLAPQMFAGVLVSAPIIVKLFVK